jgi:hypothetical protein
MPDATAVRRRMRHWGPMVVLVIVITACKPSSEVRPPFIVEKKVPAGALSGTILTSSQVQGGADIARLGNAKAMPSVVHGTAAPHSPALSADGAELAWAEGDATNGGGIGVMDTATGRWRLVTEGPGLFDHPTWGPGDLRLAFAYDASPESKWHIYVLTLASGDLRQVTFGDSTDWYPSWSPNGETIAFSSDRSGEEGIWLVSLGDLSVREIGSSAGNNEEESWSPDGGRLVYASDRIQHRWQLFVYDFSTGLEHQVIRSDTMDRFPVYSPDGRYLLVSAGYPVVYSASGGELPGGGDRWKLGPGLALGSTWAAADIPAGVDALAKSLSAPPPALVPVGPVPGSSTAPAPASAAPPAPETPAPPTLPAPETPAAATSGSPSTSGPPDTGLPPSPFSGGS